MEIQTEKVSFYKDEQGKDIYFDCGVYELSFECLRRKEIMGGTHVTIKTI